MTTTTDATTTRGTLSEATLAALIASENGALTEFAIREQVGSMRAVWALERRGLIRRRLGPEWIENDRGGMDLVERVWTVRLVHCRACGREVDAYTYHSEC